MKSFAISVVLFTSCLASFSSAQPFRGHVFLPPTRGATVLSTYIDAEARRLVAVGDFLESQAIARRIHLRSDRIAMENAVQWVETYFAKRHIRDANQPPDGLERLRLAEYKKHERIFELDPDLSGDPSDDLNTLADLLMRDSATYRSVYFEDPSNKDIDIPLTEADLKHVNLREASAVTSSAKSFRPLSPTVLDTNWPAMFRIAQFDQVRNRYDLIRQQLLREIAAGTPSYETYRKLRSALDDVQQRFAEVYHPQMAQMTSTVEGVKEWMYLERTSKQFFTSQAISSLDAVASNNLDAYSTNYKFKGDSLFDLLRHNAQNGLEFAAPKKGDEATYRKLYLQLRAVAKELYPPQYPPGQ